LKVRASDAGLAIVRRGRDFEQKHVNKGPSGLMRQIGFRSSNFVLEAAKHDGFLYASWCDLVLHLAGRRMPATEATVFLN
jgi:hypothetical protein